MSSVVLGAVLAQQSTGLTSFIPLVLIVVVFYLLLIRPQQRKARQHQDLVKATDVGDRIVTIGGIHGTIASIDEDTILLEVAPGTIITMARASIARRIVDADTAIDVTDRPDDDMPDTGPALS